ncbi:MAG: hypothetical protein OEZ29_00270 [Candidatus Bathyarchaeota archaeon]|nr:hypothetical protein [Candidatus Bathyarchaeota archaeon]MDH5779013.1 hypothetical protein [Candidatus Bathyarchaeota archaeon]
MTTPIVEINLKNAMILQRNRMITSAGDGYGITYSCLRKWKRITLCSGDFGEILEKSKKGEEIASVLNGAMTRGSG